MKKNIKKYFLEFLGTFVLLLTIVGSGIMGSNLSNNESVTLIANAISIGLILFVLISSFRSISGAHFNPAVTIMLVIMKKMKSQDGIVYIFLQITGACLGVIFANYLFGLDMVQLATKVRSGENIFVSEIFATFGLLFLILLNGRKSDLAIGSVIGSYITSAIWFTSSTSFANPAVSIARSLTDTFAGIHFSNVPMFIIAQFISIGLVLIVFKKIFK